MQREFKNRVQKKSFLVSTLLVPLIFPAVISIMVAVAINQEEGASTMIVEVLDESGALSSIPGSRNYEFVTVNGDPEQVKTAFLESDHFALLHVPQFELSDPKGFVLYTKENPSIRRMADLEDILEENVRQVKINKYRINQGLLDSLRTNIHLPLVNLTDSGEEQSTNSMVLYGLGFALGLLIYLFVMLYGMQVMLGVIEEKTSKVVEIIVSSVKPFQLMMGKILGIASVGLLKYLIWVVLIFVLSGVSLAIFGISLSPQQGLSEAMGAPVPQNDVIEVLQSIQGIPMGYVIYNFAFYFLGGFLLYAALFAAVGSAVDSQQEAQQFTFPITLPLIIGYFALFMFILNDPHSQASFWFSIIPFTSPVAMVGRLGFGVPDWQLILSQVLLIGGFAFTTWIAGRIYRVGILMHGAKVNYKVLAKWFMTRL